MKLNIKKTLPEAAGLAVGGIATGYIGKFIPIENQKIKSALPLVLGLVLAGQKGALGNVGRGMIAVGASNLAAGLGIGAVSSNIIGEVDLEDLEEVNSPMLSGTEGDGEERYY